MVQTNIILLKSVRRRPKMSLQITLILFKVDLIKVRAAMWKGREALAANVNC